MWISSVTIKDIKAFEGETTIHLDKKMNILIGENNAGKSVIIKSLNMIQNHGSIVVSDIRYLKQEASVSLQLNDVDSVFSTPLRIDRGALPVFNFTINALNAISVFAVNGSGRTIGLEEIPRREPKNFIYPFFSRRKVSGFIQAVNENLQVAVEEDFRNLVSKIERVSNPTYELYEDYVNACNDVIGFPISTFASAGGLQAGISLGRFGKIPLESMGDGIPNLVGLISDLCIAENKLFLIEEIENDIHPKALKSLLNLIISKADNNQFVISTHSNIVAKYLGAIPDSKLHHISRSYDNKIPTAIYREVGNSVEERELILEELGYELSDYNIWKGWLILEESSIERIINDFLIPEFIPDLKDKLRTISSQGVDGVESKFRDLDRLFLFIHLAPTYKNKAWVLVDNGVIGQKTIDTLKDGYSGSGWKKENFRLLTKENFEEYYPDEFVEKRNSVLAMANGMHRQAAKKSLLEDVLIWIKQDKARAKTKFKVSAQEIIDFLVEIDRALN